MNFYKIYFSVGNKGVLPATAVSDRHVINEGPFSSRLAADNRLTKGLSTVWSERALGSADYTFWVDEITWQEREAHMLTSGGYTPVVWKNEPFWTDRLRYFKDHYAHVSVEDPTMLSYTPNAEAGERDRQNRISPGKYLKKYFGKSEKTGNIKDGPLKGGTPVLTDQQIAFYAEWWAKGSKPTKYGAAELKFAASPVEIATVYYSGPRSCMSSEGISYKIADHPTRVYGAGDLNIAYLQIKGRKKKEIFARAICWPDKKVFGRVYPADGNYDSDGFTGSSDLEEARQELHNRLKAMGWTSIGERTDVLDGAKLLRIPYPKAGKGHYMMPYLDNSYTFTEKKDDKDFFYLARSGGLTGSPAGYVCVPSTFHCPCCNTMQSDVDRYGSRRVFNVVTAMDDKFRPTTTEEWCVNCNQRHTYVDTSTTLRLSAKAFPVAHDSQGYSRSKVWCEANGWYQCSQDSYWYDPKVTPALVANGGKLLSPTSAMYYGFKCRHDGVLYSMDEMSAIHCGWPKSMDGDETITAEQRAAGDLRTRTQKWLTRYSRWQCDELEASIYLDHWAMRNKEHVQYQKRKADLAKAAAIADAGIDPQTTAKPVRKSKAKPKIATNGIVITAIADHS